MANILRWVASGTVPLSVEGIGLIDCQLYEQPGRTILHIVNLTSEATWRAPVDELIRVGPFKVTMAVPARATTPRAHFLVSGAAPAVRVTGGNASFEIASMLDHELVVLA